jgi:DNA polymerase III alpha subunit
MRQVEAKENTVNIILRKLQKSKPKLSGNIDRSTVLDENGTWDWNLCKKTVSDEVKEEKKQNHVTMVEEIAQTKEATRIYDATKTENNRTQPRQSRKEAPTRVSACAKLCGRSGFSPSRSTRIAPVGSCDMRMIFACGTSRSVIRFG